MTFCNDTEPSWRDAEPSYRPRRVTSVIWPACRATGSRDGPPQPVAASLVLVRRQHDQVCRVAQKRQHRLDRIIGVGDELPRRRCPAPAPPNADCPAGGVPTGASVSRTPGKSVHSCRHARGDGASRSVTALAMSAALRACANATSLATEKSGRVQDAANDRYAVLFGSALVDRSPLADRSDGDRMFPSRLKTSCFMAESPPGIRPHAARRSLSPNRVRLQHLAAVRHGNRSVGVVLRRGDVARMPTSRHRPACRQTRREHHPGAAHRGDVPGFRPFTLPPTSARSIQWRCRHAATNRFLHIADFAAR